MREGRGKREKGGENVGRGTIAIEPTVTIFDFSSTSSIDSIGASYQLLTTVSLRLGAQQDRPGNPLRDSEGRPRYLYRLTVRSVQIESESKTRAESRDHDLNLAFKKSRCYFIPLAVRT